MVLGFWSMKETYKEMKTARFYKDIACEFTLTFMLMFAVTMTVMSFDDRPTNVYVLNVVGCYVMALIEGWAHVQLCVMNPNFCLMFCLNKTMSIPKAILYCIIEIAAASSAALLVNDMTPADVRTSLGAPGPRENVSTIANWVSEAMAVAFLVSVVLGSGDGDRKRVMLPNLAIGFAVFSVCTVGAPWGISLNPAVAFAQCLVSGDWDRYWVYVTSGAAGVIVSLLLYHFFAHDKGLMGNSKEALERFPSINMSISRSVSIADAQAVITRMESIIEAMENQNSVFSGQSNPSSRNNLQNDHQMEQNVEVRL